MKLCFPLISSSRNMLCLNSDVQNNTSLLRGSLLLESAVPVTVAPLLAQQNTRKMYKTTFIVVWITISNHPSTENETLNLSDSFAFEHLFINNRLKRPLIIQEFCILSARAIIAPINLSNIKILPNPYLLLRFGEVLSCFFSLSTLYTVHEGSRKTKGVP